MSDLFPYPGRYGKYLEDIKNLARGEVTCGEIRPVETGLRDMKLWNREGAFELILSNPLILPMRKQRQREAACLGCRARMGWAESEQLPSLGLLAFLLPVLLPLYSSLCPLHCHVSHQSRAIRKLHHLVLQTLWGSAQYPCRTLQMELLYIELSKPVGHLFPTWHQYYRKVSYFCFQLHVDKTPK